MQAAIHGYRFDDDSEYPELYTLALEARDDGPVVSQRRVVLFTRVELAAEALAMDDDAEARASILPDLIIKEVYILDVYEVLHLIANENRDDDSLLLDFFNLTFDIVTASGLALPEPYREILFPFANHLTIAYEFGDFLKDEGVARDDIRDGIFWCIGAIASRARVLR